MCFFQWFGFIATALDEAGVELKKIGAEMSLATPRRYCVKLLHCPWEWLENLEKWAAGTFCKQNVHHVTICCLKCQQPAFVFPVFTAICAPCVSCGSVIMCLFSTRCWKFDRSARQNHSDSAGSEASPASLRLRQTLIVFFGVPPRVSGWICAQFGDPIDPSMF